VFDLNRNIKFPELVEGAFAGMTVSCIVEIIGTYFFQEMHGLTCRIYQLVERPLADIPEEHEDTDATQLKGFAFLI
jgi:hypothetical protein